MKTWRPAQILPFALAVQAVWGSPPRSDYGWHVDRLLANPGIVDSNFTNTQRLKWQTALELTPDSHQVRAEALHPSTIFTAYATDTITAATTNDTIAAVTVKVGGVILPPSPGVPPVIVQGTGSAALRTVAAGTSSGRVSIYAGLDITDADAPAAGPEDTTTNITAGQMLLVAGGGSIGTDTNRLETTVNPERVLLEASYANNCVVILVRLTNVNTASQHAEIVPSPTALHC